MLHSLLPTTALAALAIAVAPSVSAAQDCPYGAYRSASGDIVSLTRPAKDAGPGARYTFLDGRRGFLSDAGAPLACKAGKLQSGGKGDSTWLPVETHATPTHFRSNDVTLNGLLLEPIASAARPLVVLVHGSEKTSPIGLATQYLMVSQGLAVFAYDKRGTEGSEGIYTQDFITLAEDAANAGREARRLAGSRAIRFGYYGGSQGGWVAPLAALKTNADFLEVGFGVVGTALEQDQWQVDYQLIHERGYAPGILSMVHALTDATAVVARSDFRTGMERVDTLEAEFAGEPWLKEVDGQYSGGLIAGRVAQMHADSPRVTWTYSGLDVIRSLRVPQLWAFAADDDVAPSAPSIERLDSIRREGTSVRMIVFPDTTHGIVQIAKDASGGRRDTGNFAPGYFQLLADLAKGTTRSDYGTGRWLGDK